MSSSTTPYLNASHTSSNDGRPPIIVQGTEVKHQGDGLFVTAAPTVQGYQPPDGIISSSAPLYNADDVQREPVPRRCNDVIWAILFLGHLVVMIWVAATFVPQMTNQLGGDYAGDANNDNHRRLLVRLRFLEDNNNNYNGWNYNNNADNNDVSLDLAATLEIVAVSCLSGFLLSTLALGFMVLFAETLIRVGFVVTILLTLLSGLASLLVGQVAGAVMSLLFFGVLIMYACRVWSRIPFAATNLVTATTIVRDNLGVAFYAYLSLFLAFGWAIWWTSATISTLFVLGDCEGDGTCNNDINPFVVFLFFVSYYWTFQVIGNVVTVTVAGVSGTWWMVPLEGKRFCSKAVTDSYYRANTLAFGSICLGSLIVAIISAIREMVRQMRESGDSMLACCAECLLACIESLVEYFNEWAFCFVGIYGYSFMDAGVQVFGLLKSRGWMSIITDDLTGRALLMVTFCVGLLNGLLGLLLGSVVGMGEGVPLFLPFLIALVTGFTLCSTLFSVVGSAVKSVIVLYAEAPNEFQANHPELSNRMRASWQQAWPVEFKY